MLLYTVRSRNGSAVPFNVLFKDIFSPSSLNFSALNLTLSGSLPYCLLMPSLLYSLVFMASVTLTPFLT